jgi:hypothetical protein
MKSVKPPSFENINTEDWASDITANEWPDFYAGVDHANSHNCGKVATYPDGEGDAGILWSV